MVRLSRSAALAGVFVATWTATGGAAVCYVDGNAAAGGDGLSWATAYDSLSTARCAAQGSDQVWVAAGTYVGNFTLALGVEVYGGFAGTETELSQRDWTANPTILNGDASGSVVTAPTGATATTRIDGFTITNGSGTELYDYTVGGGLYLSRSSPMITNNTITGNGAGDDGGGIFLWDSSPMIANNRITGNSAGHGGGLYLSRSSPMITNNTITGNGAGDGGGLTARYNSSPTIANTIVAFNSSGIFLWENGGTLTLRYNCVYGNTAYDYSGLTDPTGTDGNISADPLLADPEYGNVHIQPTSPCVDAGRNADVHGEFDMDGEPRLQLMWVDIGADESNGTVWPAGPYTIVRVSLVGNDANDGSSWTLAKRTVQAGIDAASELGGEVWVHAGTYEECITLHPYAYVYGGFAGGETVREERDWSVLVTTLDAQQQGSVVTAEAGYRVSAINGFTITNGSARHGGGLYLRNSSATITNNTITDNSAGWNGGGFYVLGSSPTIANNTITGNSASGGGGLCLWRASPTVANNTITANSAYNGGGLYLVRFFSPTISPTIANNAITGNIADNGGGLYLWKSSPRMVNNTITGNSAADGGGLYVRNYSSPTIANTIIAFNSSGGYLCEDSGTPTLRYNCVYGNSEYDYSGLDDPTGSDGNISADPRFIRNPDDGGDGWGDDPTTPEVDEGANDDFGDLELLFGSPGIDAGDNDAVPRDELDMDGDGDINEPVPFDLASWPRFVDDPDTLDTGDPGELGPPVVDMGAYEFRPTVIVPLDIMPARCPNRLPVKAQGMIRIALLGTDLLDVSNVDLDSLLLTRADGVGGSIGPRLTPPGLAPKVRDVATPFEGELCDCHHQGQDGVDDLLLVFSGGTLVRTLQLKSVLDETPIELTLSGALEDRTVFEASDCVQIAHPGSPPAPKRNGWLRRR